MTFHLDNNKIQSLNYLFLKEVVKDLQFTPNLIDRQWSSLKFPYFINFDLIESLYPVCTNLFSTNKVVENHPKVLLWDYWRVKDVSELINDGVKNTVTEFDLYKNNRFYVFYLNKDNEVYHRLTSEISFLTIDIIDLDEDLNNNQFDKPTWEFNYCNLDLIPIKKEDILFIEKDYFRLGNIFDFYKNNEIPTDFFRTCYFYYTQENFLKIFKEFFILLNDNLNFNKDDYTHSFEVTYLNLKNNLLKDYYKFRPDTDLYL